MARSPSGPASWPAPFGSRFRQATAAPPTGGALETETPPAGGSSSTRRRALVALDAPADPLVGRSIDGLPHEPIDADEVREHAKDTAECESSRVRRLLRGRPVDGWGHEL